MKYYNCLSIGIAALVMCTQAGLSNAAEVDALTVQSEGSEPVATIGGSPVTRDELTSFAVQLEQAEGGGVGGGEELLNEYILTQLYDQIPTTASLPTVGKSDATSTAPTPYSSIAQRGLLKRELRTWMSDNIDVPRDAMEAWYQANLSKYEKPERIHAYHIFLETSEDTPSSAPEQVRTRLAELKTQIDAGTSFSEVAEKHSEAASSETGGEIGWISRRLPIGPLSKPMNLELENALFALTPGKASDIVDTRHGMHLLYVADRETTKTPSLDDMISSGILPGAVVQDRLTSEMRTLVESTIEKYKGEALPEGSNQVTTDTVAFRFDGKDFKIGDLNTLFGPRFTRYLESTMEDPEAVKTLLGQAMEDEAMVRAAIDKGIAEKADIARELELLAKREVARTRINAIAEAEATVSEEQIQSRYRELADQLRMPEAQGFVLVVESEEATGTAEQARAREEARKKAEELRAQLTPENFESMTQKLAASGDSKTSVTKVPRHVIGQSTDTQTRIFDQVISRIQEASGLSDVMPLSKDFAIGYLVKRDPGEPVSIEVVRERLESMMKAEAMGKARESMVKRLEEKGLVEYKDGAAEFGKFAAGSAGDALTSAPVDNETTSTN